MIQKRQPIFDFPIYALFEQQLMNGRISHNIYLQKDIKDHYPIIQEKDLELDSIKPTIMILVESWGVRKDFKLNDIEFNIFNNNNIRLKGIFSRKASYTQGAEWEDFNIPLGKKENVPLQEKYKQSGFTTWYLHGYDGNFYERQNTYSTLGFDNLNFRENFKAKHKKECNYGFEGICDSSIIAFIDSIASSSQRSFIYWTTLDSHPPFETQEVPQTEICNELNNIECIHTIRIQNTLLNIAKLAKKHPEYRFILRGDHRPMGSLTSGDFITSFYHLWVPVIVLN